MWLIAHAGDLLDIAAIIVLLASAIAALTPSGVDNRIVGRIRQVVDVLALNIGHARKPAE